MLDVGIYHLRGLFLFCFPQTWKGMVRLIFSPTFLMYFVRRCRGRRIFGCSNEGKASETLMPFLDYRVSTTT